MNPILRNDSPAVNKNILTPKDKDDTITLISGLMEIINPSMTSTLRRSLKDSTIEERDATLNQLKNMLLESARKIDEFVSKDKQLLQRPVVAPQANPIPLAAQQPNPPMPVQQAVPILPSNSKARQESKQALENIQTSLFLPLTILNAVTILRNFVKNYLNITSEDDFFNLFKDIPLESDLWESTLTVTINSKVFTAKQRGETRYGASGNAMIAIIKKLRVERDFYKDFLIPMNLPLQNKATSELMGFLQKYSKDCPNTLDQEFQARFTGGLSGPPPLSPKLSCLLLLNYRTITLKETTIDTGVTEKEVPSAQLIEDLKKKARDQAALGFFNLLYDAPRTLTFEDHLELLRKYSPKGEGRLELEDDLPAQAVGPQVETLPQTAPEDGDDDNRSILGSDDGNRSVLAFDFGNNIKEFRKVSRRELVGVDGKAEKNLIKVGDGATVYRYLTSSVRKFYGDYPLLSVGSSIEREIISLDSKGSEQLSLKFSLLNTRLISMAKEKPLSTQEVLRDVSYFVRAYIFNNGAGIQKVISKKKCQTVRFEDEVNHTKADIPIIPIDAFVEARIGVCRQHSLVTSYLLYRLTQEAEPLIRGTVKHIRDVVQGGAHAWTAFIPQSQGPNEPLEKWSIDTMWDHIGNFATPAGIASLKAKYDVKGSRDSAIENMIRKTRNAARENKQEAAIR